MSALALHDNEHQPHHEDGTQSSEDAGEVGLSHWQDVHAEVHQAGYVPRQAHLVLQQHIQPSDHCGYQTNFLINSKNSSARATVCSKI